MATIDLKLKTYEQLQFEVMNLSTKNYLQQQELDKYKNIVDELEKWVSIQLKVAEKNIVESEKWLEVEEEKEHAKKDIHTGKVIKKYMNEILKILKGE